MWQLVFPDIFGRVSASCTEEQATVEGAIETARIMNRVNDCRYELMKASELPLLKGPTLPELIAAGKVPHPHFKMRKSEEPQDGWTDPTVLAQLTERDIA